MRSPLLAASAHRALCTVLVAPALVAAWACVSAPASPAERRLAPGLHRLAPGLKSLGPTSFLITGTALAGERSRPLHEVVERHWPGLVRGPLVITPAEAMQWDARDRFGVYANGSFLGGPEYLQLVPAYHVVRVERLGRQQEMVRYGRRHPAGAVVLTFGDPGVR